MLFKALIFAYWLWFDFDMSGDYLATNQIPDKTEWKQKFLMCFQVYSKIFGIISPYITQRQHVFLSGRSTVSQLAQVVH